MELQVVGSASASVRASLADGDRWLSVVEPVYRRRTPKEA